MGSVSCFYDPFGMKWVNTIIKDGDDGKKFKQNPEYRRVGKEIVKQHFSILFNVIIKEPKSDDVRDKLIAIRGSD